jgi:short-subunit dehydrogenase
MSTYVVLGSSSYIAKLFVQNISKKNKVISLSRSNSYPRIKNVLTFKTDYSKKSLNKIFNHKIFNTHNITYLFFNSLADHKAFYYLNEKEIKKIININFLQPILFTKQILNTFSNLKINFIFISSSRAISTDEGIAIYSSTKNGITAFSKCMAIEYGKLNKNFRVVSLGIFKGGLKNQLSQKNHNKIMDRTAIKKMISIQQFIKCVRFIEKDTSGNGSIIKLDNGYF